MESETPVSISMFRVLLLISISVRNGCDSGYPRRAIRKAWSMSSPVPVSPASCEVLEMRSLRGSLCTILFVRAIFGVTDSCDVALLVAEIAHSLSKSAVFFGHDWNGHIDSTESA